MSNCVNYCKNSEFGIQGLTRLREDACYLKRNKSDIYTENKIKEYSDNAIKSLDAFSGDAKQSLIDLTNFCSQRIK